MQIAQKTRQKKKVGRKMGNKSEDLNQLVLSTLSKTTKLPFVKVSREEFLRKEFKGSEYLDIILKNGPQSVFTPEALRKRATKIINDTTKKTAFTSFVAGLPANPITATLSGGADIIQYFGFSLNLAQQLAYLFGEDELFTGEFDELPEEAKARMIGYLGVMLGAGGAAALITKVSKNIAENVGKKVVTTALTKKMWYPIMKKIAAFLGWKITKMSVQKTVTKVIPVIGGVFSGGLTYYTFKPSAERLANTFEKLLKGEFIEDDVSINDLSDDFKEYLKSDEAIIDGEYTEVE